MSSKKYIIFSILILIGCQSGWYFTITDLNDYTQPVFCFSKLRNCINKGAHLVTINIYELDNSGHKLKDKWLITSAGADFFIKEVKYGTVPGKWKEEYKSEPLELNKWYGLNSRYCFLIYKKENKYDFIILTYGDYLKGKRT